MLNLQEIMFTLALVCAPVINSRFELQNVAMALENRDERNEVAEMKQESINDQELDSLVEKCSQHLPAFFELKKRLF